MMKRILFFLAVWTLSGSSYAQSNKSDTGQFLFACGDDMVLMIDQGKSTNDHLEVVWQWSVKETKGLPASYVPLLRTVDDCKPLNGGKHLLLTASSGATLLLDRLTKTALFYAQTPMAHSAAYLPQDRIVVALSTHKQGNSLQLYSKNKPNQIIWQDTLYSGHGVVWQSEEEKLYVLGYAQLKVYALQDWKGDMPKLRLIKSWKLPSIGGHDLIAASANHLVVTTHDHVWEFNIPDEKWSPFKPLADLHNIKSVNYKEDTKELIYTKAEESWWSHHIYLQDKVLQVPQMKLYKVRKMY